MNPILKKVTGKRVTPKDIGDLLEKHLGLNPNEFHCKQALEAIDRIQDSQVRTSIKVMRLCIDETICHEVKQVVAYLRILDFENAFTPSLTKDVS